jgi:hypothetical protein
MSQILTFTDWRKGASLNENIQAAKAYLTKKANEDPEFKRFSEDGKDPLKHPDYLKILELLKSNQGYVYPFVRFRFEHKASMEQLEEIYHKIKENPGAIAQLPMTIEEYSKQTRVNGVNPAEALIDEFVRIETRKKHRWIIDKVNGDLRRSIKALPKESIDRLLVAARVIDEADAESGDYVDPETGKVSNNKITLLKKTNAFTDGAKYLAWVEEYANGVANSDIKSKINEIKQLEPEAGILYSNGGYLAISVRTESAQKALCSSAAWCINRGSWGSYGGKAGAIQINIFNFNLPTTNVQYITGTTITNGKVTASHDKEDANLLTTSDPADHLSKYYPKELVEVVVSKIEREVKLKQFITNLGVDNAKAEQLLESVIKLSYQLDRESNEADRNVMVTIIKDHLLNKLSEQEIVSTYSKLGVLSEFSARVLNSLFPNLSKETKDKVIDATSRIMTQLKTILARTGRDYNPTLTNAVDHEDEIIEIIISGDSITDAGF